MLGYVLPCASNGPAYLNAVGKLVEPFGQSAMYGLPSKSRSPFCVKSCSHAATAQFQVVLAPFTTTVRGPDGAQMASENSQSPAPAGQAPPPSVVALVQAPVVKLHGPSPVPPGSMPPMQVQAACWSKENPSGVETLEQDSKCPISCCIRTPPSSAAHGTWFCLEAVSYSGWNAKGVPPHVRELVFMNPLASLATMKPVWPVVRSVTVVKNPAGVSWSVACTLSPGFIFSVWALGAKLASFKSCGLGGPAGTPSVWRYAKFTGSMQLLLQNLKLKLHERLSMVSATQYWVWSQLNASLKGPKPGG